MTRHHRIALPVVLLATAAAMAVSVPHSTAGAQQPGQGASSPAPQPPRAVAVQAELTLSDALRLAATHNPMLQSAAGRRLSRVGSASQLSAFANPHLEWRREGVGASAPTDEFLTVALPVDITGRRLVARGAVSATDRSAVADSQAVARAVLFDAARAYHRAALGAALHQAAERRRSALTAIAVFDSTRWREGAVAEGVALRTALEADRGSAEAALAAVDADRLRAELARALGVAADSLGMPSPLHAGSLQGPAALSALTDLESLQARALAQRPELLAARAAVEAAERRATSERLGMLGDVTVGGGTRSSGGDRGATMSVGFSFPLLDRNGPARQVARGELLQARAALRETELAIRAQVAAAAASYERLHASLSPLASNVGTRGADVAQIVQAAYREGGATLFELLDAQRAAADLDAAALRWITDLQVARLDLLQALGDPLPEAP